MADDWDESTPVTDIVDPKRNALEAELQIANATARDLRNKWLESEAKLAEANRRLEKQAIEILRLKKKGRP